MRFSLECNPAMCRATRGFRKKLTIINKVALLGALTAAVGCTSSNPVSGNPSPSGIPRPPGSSQDVPTVADVVCSGSDVRTVTQLVGPQPDGIHIRLNNRAAGELSYQLGSVVPDSGTEVDYLILSSGLRFAPASMSAGDSRIRAGEVEESAWVVPPGRIAVLCGAPGEPLESDRMAVGLLTLVDDAGVYHSADLDCAELRNYEIYFPRNLRESPRSLLTGLREQDVFEYAEYPEQPLPAFRVVRAGRTVAVMRAGSGASGRGVISACADSGLSRAGA